MKFGAVFDQQINESELQLSFADFQWCMPLNMRHDQNMMDALHEVFQMLIVPCGEFFWEATNPYERSKLICAILFDRMMRENLIQPCKQYEFVYFNDEVELQATYGSSVYLQPVVLVRIRHLPARHTLRVKLRSTQNANLSGTELKLEFHEDNLASVNCMRQLISFVAKVQRKYP